MENFTDILLWIGIFAGGLMMLLLLGSTLAGLDIDSDVDIDGGDGDISGGDLGLLKSILTFLSVGSFMTRAIALNSQWHWGVAIAGGIISGIIAVVLLTILFRFLLKQQAEGNYYMWQAEGKKGKVYIPIPPNGFGKVTIEINGALRELPAKSEMGIPLSTGQKIIVVKALADHLIVDSILG